MAYTQEEIKARYDRLPDDLKKAMGSVDTTNLLVNIGQKHDLMFDQIEELVSEVSMIMLGFIPSSRFVGDISRSIHIDTGKALEIARDVNNEVFDKMRKSLQKLEMENEKEMQRKSDQQGNSVAEKGEKEEAADDGMTKASVVSAVERAGGFVIEKPEGSSGYDKATEKPASKEVVINMIERETPIAPAIPAATLPNKAPIVTDPEHLLEDVPETPKEAASAPKQAMPEAPKHEKPDQSSIIDTLLSKGVAIPMDKPEASAAANPAKQDQPKKVPYAGPDPYREPIN